MPQRIGATPNYQTVTIALNQTASSNIDCRNGQLVGFYTPAALTGTTWSLQGSNDGSTFVTVLDDGDAYSKTMAASRYISVKLSVTAGLEYVRIVSGSTEASARSIICVLRPVS